jgi:hypothetical protein
MEEVGNRWADGRMSVLQEHLVTATTIHALNRMAEMVPRQVASGRTALCCPADRETHSIGVEMTRLMLESLGWSTRVAVSPTPFDEVAEFLRAEKPDLICVSIVQTGNGALRDRLHEVHAVARETGTLLALGGRGIQNRDDLPNDFMGRTLKELENFARNLVTRRRGVGVEDRINGRQQA